MQERKSFAESEVGTLLRGAAMFAVSVMCLWGAFHASDVRRFMEAAEQRKYGTPPPTPTPVATPSPLPSTPTPTPTATPTPSSTKAKKQHKKLPDEEYESGITESQMLAIRLGISLIVLISSLFVILAKRYGPTEKHWAYATVGTLLGFWLKG